MTLVLNEIHLLRGLEQTMLVAAGDRRISRFDGSYDSTHRKFLAIPYLKGAIAYFGLAMFYPGSKPVYLSDWLPDFVKRHSSASDFKGLAESLQGELNRIVPSAVLSEKFAPSAARPTASGGQWHLVNCPN